MVMKQKKGMIELHFKILFAIMQYTFSTFGLLFAAGTIMMYDDRIAHLEQQVEQLSTQQHVGIETAILHNIYDVKPITNQTIEVKSEPTLEPLGEFHATAYTLGIESTGKTSKHPAYGITYTGVDLKGQTRDSARAIAVDPNVIPLGSEVYVEFDEEYQHFNGIYKAVDTGSAIKGNDIDIFIPDVQEAKTFGSRVANVYKIKEDI